MGGASIMKRVLSYLIILTLVVALAGCGGQKPTEKEPTEEPTSSEGKLKVALLLPGPVDDGGWNGNAYEALMEAKTESDSEVSFMENIAQPDFEEAFRDYASNGYSLVIGHGFQFQDAATKVAPDYPDTKFIIFNGSASQEPNVASIHFFDWEAGYIGGAMAGLVTKTNKVGGIGGMEIPVIYNAIEGYKAGAKAVNPNVEVLTSYVGTWDDIPKGKETALAMISNGCDVVTCDANQVGLGSIAACKEAGVYAIGFVSDQANVAPDHVIGSTMQNTGVLVKLAIRSVKDGTFKPEVQGVGVKEGAHGFVWNPKFEKSMPDLVTKIKEIEQDIIDGKITAPPTVK